LSRRKATLHSCLTAAEHGHADILPTVERDAVFHR
jgi:hypothetical protein